MDKEYHTLNEGIPANGGPSRIGMDTKNRRNGLMLWITTIKVAATDAEAEWYGVPKGELYTDSQTVHLTREDAENLIEEIEHRLF